MALLRFPYTNLHELNLDWIIEQLNKEGAVLSVNDKHGVVVLTGEDIVRSSINSQTIEQALTTQGTSIQAVRTQIGTTALPTTAQTITGAIAENAGEIADLQDDVIGNTPLPTTAQTLTGAIAENAGEIANQQDLIGSTALPTTAQTITGAIAEHESDIITLNDRFTIKSYVFDNLSFEAGLIGIRAVQDSKDLTSDITTYGTPISALITSISDSGKCQFQAFMYGASLYVNGYSATTNAMTGNSVTVRVTFKKS